MQYHLNGFRPGDPAVSPKAGLADAGTLPDELDVLIVGSGPTGLVLASQLAAFPDIRTGIVEQKSSPLEIGQADGIACRSMEMFEAFGFSEKILKEAYWVNETTFWRPDAEEPSKITRSGRIQDTEDGLSEFPHVILNQARVHDFFLETMRNAPTALEPWYNHRIKDLKVEQGADYPLTVTLERTDEGHECETHVLRAKYVVGCDGARSRVREAIGRKLTGDSANQAWGVMDVFAVTDFPDIRMKATVHSAEEGNLLVIPREGGYMVRLYIELDKLKADERVASRNITLDKLVAAAKRILHPYTLEVKETAWWSVYEIGQRLCDKFDDVPVESIDHQLPHVFIAGDACHTHSPKAGQGMNVSMRDGFNLGWKLAAVLRGQAVPEILHSYSAERQGVAKMLIDFDREFARMFSAKPKSGDNKDGVDPEEFQKYFVQHGRFTAGTAIQYAPSVLTGEDTHQALATGFPLGMRFHSAPVIRLSDARPMHLGHVVRADGRWRLFAFAGADDRGGEGGRLHSLCRFLETDETSPVRRYTPADSDIDSVLDLRAVLQQDFRSLTPGDMPGLLRPLKGKYGLRDYEKVFCPDLKSGQDIFDMRGIDRIRGCMVLVRPDQHVAQVLPLDAHEQLGRFFDAFMILPSGLRGVQAAAK
ncbi:FAD-binding monooxygenase [Phycobacter sp. K97]|uniref:FAD-binding monooxygenase n=1 Tax=Phycobacter sedimenti TaxID=3133977 RepID=UPI00311FABC6